MKTFGETLIVIAVFGFALGLGFIALAYRNINDLFVWAALGMLGCVGSLVLGFIGWLLKQAAPTGQNETNYLSR